MIFKPDVRSLAVRHIPQLALIDRFIAAQKVLAMLAGLTGLAVYHTVHLLHSAVFPGRRETYRWRDSSAVGNYATSIYACSAYSLDSSLLSLWHLATLASDATLKFAIFFV